MSGDLDSNLNHSPFNVSSYGMIKANFIPSSSFVEQYGNIISSTALTAFIILPIQFSAKPELLSKTANSLISKNIIKIELADIDNTDILGIDVAIIAGVSIFLSLKGFEGSE